MANTLYSTAPIKFSLRFWHEYRYNPMIGIAFIAAILIFAKTYNILICIFCIVVFIATVLLPIIDSRKWAIRQLVSIAEEGDSYIINTFHKDEEQTFVIKKTHLGTKLKWIGSRPQVLTLTIFDQGNTAFKLYSGVKQHMTYELQKMEYVLK